MMWSSAYYFEVTVHQILAELCPFEIFFKLFVFCKLFVSSNRLHPIQMKLDSLLDYGMEQRILFRGYSTSNMLLIKVL